MQETLQGRLYAARQNQFGRGKPAHTTWRWGLEHSEELRNYLTAQLEKFHWTIFTATLLSENFLTINWKNKTGVSALLLQTLYVVFLRIRPTTPVKPAFHNPGMVFSEGNGNHPSDHNISAPNTWARLPLCREQSASGTQELSWADPPYLLYIPHSGKWLKNE